MPQSHVEVDRMLLDAGDLVGGGEGPVVAVTEPQLVHLTERPVLQRRRVILEGFAGVVGGGGDVGPVDDLPLRLRGALRCRQVERAVVLRRHVDAGEVHEVAGPLHREVGEVVTLRLERVRALLHDDEHELLVDRLLPDVREGAGPARRGRAVLEFLHGRRTSTRRVQLPMRNEAASAATHEALLAAAAHGEGRAVPGGHVDTLGTK